MALTIYGRLVPNAPKTSLEFVDCLLTTAPHNFRGGGIAEGENGQLKENDNMLSKKISIIALLILAAFITSLMYIEYTSHVDPPVWLSPVYVAMFILIIIAVAVMIYAASKGIYPPVYPDYYQPCGSPRSRRTGRSGLYSSRSSAF